MVTGSKGAHSSAAFRPICNSWIVEAETSITALVQVKFPKTGHSDSQRFCQEQEPKAINPQNNGKNLRFDKMGSILTFKI